MFVFIFIHLYVIPLFAIPFYFISFYIPNVYRLIFVPFLFLCICICSISLHLFSFPPNIVMIRNPGGATPPDLLVFSLGFSL